MNNQTLLQLIEIKTSEYAAIPLFQALAQDKIPLERFSDFFKEQYMTARFFQDVIWATTEIPSGPYADFAKQHRQKDSGHYKWMETDLNRFGIPAMTSEDWFRQEWLPTRLQMYRILSLCHNATPEELMIILACMENAGNVTLGTLFGYVQRHGLGDKTLYLGNAHLKIEEKQVGDIEKIAAELLQSSDNKYKKIITEVFDALTQMFNEGGKRYYDEYLH